MRHLKMLGIVAAAVTALAAFVGASNASATVLCKEAGTGSPTGTTCPSGQAYAAGQEIHAVNVGNVSLDTSFKTITCTSSTIKASINSEEGTQLSGPEGTLTFGGCNCTVTVIKAGILSFEWVGGSHNGTVRSTGMETTTVCSVLGFPVHCTYVTNSTHTNRLFGGADPTIGISVEIPVDAAHSDAACPETSDFTATYTVTTPKPLFVTGHT